MKWASTIPSGGGGSSAIWNLRWLGLGTRPDLLSWWHPRSQPGLRIAPVNTLAGALVCHGWRLRAAPADHRSHDQPLIVQPAAVPVHHLRDQPGSAEPVRPLPGRARTGADRWNIG